MKKLLSLTAVLVISLTACAQKAPKVIRLLEPSYDEGLTLMQALKERKSSQGFTEKEISLQDLSNILWASVGVNRPDGRRTAGENPPGGGAATVSYVDVGYVSQNVYLACANAGIGSRARGGWDQQKLTQTLGLKPSLVVVLGQTVGYCNE